ncbi:MAG: substrate-binding domain-containing protein, partial [Tannerella sp.]|nr:substrate-binding domain-containing protein [Tannerella sp.]
MRRTFGIYLWALTLTACSTEEVRLSGAGASFPAPYYSIAFKAYASSSGCLVNYGAIGSGGGLRSLADRTVDFGATDVFLS